MFKNIFTIYYNIYIFICIYTIYNNIVIFYLSRPLLYPCGRPRCRRPHVEHQNPRLEQWTDWGGQISGSVTVTTLIPALVLFFFFPHPCPSPPAPPLLTETLRWDFTQIAKMQKKKHPRITKNATTFCRVPSFLWL